MACWLQRRIGVLSSVVADLRDLEALLPEIDARLVVRLVLIVFGELLVRLEHLRCRGRTPPPVLSARALSVQYRTAPSQCRAALACSGCARPPTLAQRAVAAPRKAAHPNERRSAAQLSHGVLRRPRRRRSYGTCRTREYRRAPAPRKSSGWPVGIIARCSCARWIGGGVGTHSSNPLGPWRASLRHLHAPTDCSTK
jgi:hypothetical protein